MVDANLQTKLEALVAAHPKRDDDTGQMYNTRKKGQTYKKVTLHAVFTSDEGTFMLRGHVFGHPDKALTGEEWRDWFKKNYGTVLRNGVLPGLATRTGKQWRVHRVIGWVGTNAAQRAKNTKTRVRGNQTKRKGA